MIEWEGVRIPLEDYGDKKTISNNSYISVTIKQIVDHTNQDFSQK